MLLTCSLLLLKLSVMLYWLKCQGKESWIVLVIYYRLLHFSYKITDNICRQMLRLVSLNEHSVLIKQCEYKCLSGCLCLFDYVHVCTSYQCLSSLDCELHAEESWMYLKVSKEFNILLWNKTNPALARQYIWSCCRKNSMKTS